MWLTLTEFIQNRDESAPRLQVLRPQSIQGHEEQRLTLEAVKKTKSQTGRDARARNGQTCIESLLLQKKGALTRHVQG